MKTLRSLFPILVLLVSVTCTAQPLVPKKCYQRLSGRIGNDFTIEMNLVKINDTLYGDYFFLRTGKLPEGKNYQDGGMIPLYGKVKADGTFTLRENPWSKGGRFTGRFTGGSGISGTWESMDGGFKAPFTLTESYPGGSVPMNVFSLKGSVPLVKKQGSPRASFEYAMMLPAESANPVFSDSLTRLVLQKFANRSIQDHPDPEQLLLGMRQVYFDNYIASNEAIYTHVKGMSFDWQSIKSMNILLNGSGILSFFVESYAFTGGAHGISSRDCYAILLENGKILNTEELFIEGYEPELTRLLTEKLRQEQSIPASTSLKDAGFFVDSVHPSPNFYVTRNGIGFFYNYYEIAPHSSGPTDLFLPFADLERLLKKGSPLKDLAGR